MHEEDTHPIVIWTVNISGHPEVSDLHQQPVPHEAVAGGQVTVHKMLRRQVDHPCRYLRADVKHLREAELSVRLNRLTVHQDHGVGTVSSEMEHKCEKHAAGGYTFERE